MRFQNDPKILADVRASFTPKRFIGLLREAHQVLSRLEVTQLQREFAEIETKKAATEKGSVQWQRLHQRALEMEGHINAASDVASGEIRKMFKEARCLKAIRDDALDLRRAIEAAKGKKTEPIAKAYREVGLAANAEAVVADIVQPLNRFISDHVDPLAQDCEARLTNPNHIITGEGHWGVASIAGWVLCGQAAQTIEVS